MKPEPFKIPLDQLDAPDRDRITTALDAGQTILASIHRREFPDLDTLELSAVELDGQTAGKIRMHYKRLTEPKPKK